MIVDLWNNTDRHRSRAIYSGAGRHRPGECGRRDAHDFSILIYNGAENAKQGAVIVSQKLCRWQAM
jgi:hypothetical protein